MTKLEKSKRRYMRHQLKNRLIGASKLLKSKESYYGESDLSAVYSEYPEGDRGLVVLKIDFMGALNARA